MTGIDMETLAGRGYSPVTLDDAGAGALDAVMTAARRFFAESLQWKQRHGNGLDGYRPRGSEFSADDRLGAQAPAQPDECETFTFWGNEPGRLPMRGEFVRPLRDFWLAAAALTDDLLAQLAARYRYPDELDYAPYSYVEVNSYSQQAEPEWLQTTHQDGHLATIVFTDAPGLEIEVDGEMQPWQGGPREGIIMAGGLLTAMTGEIPPLYHAVRNHDGPRLAVLFFVNPPMIGYVRPYAESDANLRADFAGMSVAACSMFGKPYPALPGRSPWGRPDPPHAW